MILEERQNSQICCPDEITFDCGYISEEQLIENSKLIFDQSYKQYLIDLANS